MCENTILPLKKKITKLQLGKRLDIILFELLEIYSRSKIKNWILNGKIRINGKLFLIPKKKIFFEGNIEIFIPLNNENIWKPKKINFNVIYEDNDILVIDKPYNMVVHPGFGNQNSTILNGLVYRYPNIINVPRAGIVHRLDKNTTGLMVIAKNVFAQTKLIDLFKKQKIHKEYHAIVFGLIKENGKIEFPISRDIKKRTKMAVRLIGKSATTYYYVLENFRFHTYLLITPKTGRTHQIRVHMSYINHPIVGDVVYKGSYSTKKFSKNLYEAIFNFKRQALHATSLEFYHPTKRKKIKFYSSLPDDMIQLIKFLRLEKKSK